MRISVLRFRLGVVLGACWLAGASLVRGQVVPTAAAPETLPIDLPTALRLAGAQNLDIQLAREKLSLAKANRDIAIQQFFPWLAPGVAYRRHDNRIQDTTGTILDVNKQSYTVGGALTAQVDLGEAWFRELAARQLVKAAGHALDTQREQTVWQAALGYFDLVRARAGVDIARDALRIATDYEGQLRNAVEAGIALKGDVLRAQVQAEQSRVALRNAQKETRVAAARLAQVLRLDATVELVPPADELAPISLVAINAKLGALVAQALASRPELKERQASSPPRKMTSREPWLARWCPASARRCLPADWVADAAAAPATSATRRLTLSAWAGASGRVVFSTAPGCGPPIRG